MLTYKIYFNSKIKIKKPESAEQSIRQTVEFEAKKWLVSHYAQDVEFKQLTQKFIV